MYMLWGGGSPFSVICEDELRDASGRSVRLLGASGKVLHDLKHHEAWKGTIVAWVSCTDEPEWAEECLRKFQASGGAVPDVAVPIGDCAHSSMIFKANKKEHFRRLKSMHNIEYSDMLFFDNEQGNIRSVESLGVKCIYCPDGLTASVWKQGLDLFA